MISSDRNIKRSSRAGLTFLLLTAVLAIGHSQTLNPSSWVGRVEPSQLHPGDKAKVLLSAKIDAGWHLYSLTQPPPPRAAKIALEENSIFLADGNPQQPKPKLAFDPNFQIETETFEKEVTFTVPIKVAADAPAGAQKFNVKVTFQLCDDQRCLPPRTRPIEVEATIVAAANRANLPATPTLHPSTEATKKPEAAAPVVPTDTPTVTPTVTPTPASAAPLLTQNPPAPPAYQPQRAGQSGLAGYIWLAMGFGFLALLTPCVFPMIPITVSFFTKNQQGSTWSTVKQALIYCFGIIFTFAGLGLALTLIAGPAGINKVAASPWMNLFLTALFVIFALNLFGMFEIRVPSKLLSSLDTRSQSGTLAATLLMGLTFTLTSFTCTAAFVGTVLVAATQGEWFWSAIGMVAFATAFAAPFFLLALFPKWLSSLPSSGGWLNSVKVVMGFLELAAAFKFLSNVDLVWGWHSVSRSVVLAAWVAIALIAAIYLLGKIQLPYDTPLERLSVARMLLSVFFLGLAFYLLAGLFGARLGELDAFLPPAQAENRVVTTGGEAGSKWLGSFDAAIEQGRATNRPVFVNFTGVTCTNCRWMEANVFTDANVKRELDRFVLAELYTDRETPEDEFNSKLQETRFKTVALPLYVIVAPDGTQLGLFAGLTRDKSEFIRFLQSGANRAPATAQSATAERAGG
jgi:thiol:disulfide interchange protein